MRLEGVIFDWGGTLSTFAEVELGDLWRAAAERLAPQRADEVCQRLAAVEAASWARTATTQRSARLADLLDEASGSLDLDVTDAVLEQAATSHLDAWTPHITHDPEAAPTLEALRERGLRIGLLSNTHWPRAFHERFLERDGLVDLIDARVYTSELPWTKPHPAAFRAALDAIDVHHPAAVAFVGDRPLDDVRGAKQSGLRAVWRPNPHLPPAAVTPDAVIHRLPQLVEVVDEWLD
jgi:putative hydrolase of the HAD superfamily